jgi:RES domain-containing protein
VSLPDGWRAALDVLAGAAKPFENDCFRSVELAYGYPDDVVSGEGTRLHGGRFVPQGMPAVHASLDEETGTREVSARKARLGGRAQIRLKDYPRLTYVISVTGEKCVDFRPVDRSTVLGQTLAAALDLSDLTDSQVVGQYLVGKGVQAAVVPSIVGPGANIVVFIDARPRPKIEIRNREEILEAIQRLARRT